MPDRDTPRILLPDGWIEKISPLGMLNLRGPGNDADFLRAAASGLGIDLPTSTNRYVTVADRSAIRLGPDEWLLTMPIGAEVARASQLESELHLFHHAVTDVTGSLEILRLRGGHSREVLSAGCSIDLDLISLVDGHCAQTKLSRADIILVAQDAEPTFDILVRRSFADYLWSWLHRTASNIRPIQEAV